MPTPDANAEPVDAVPMHNHDHRLNSRPTFHVSREMVCFLGGIAVTLGVLWAVSNLGNGKSKRRDD